jgi:hypothetical protein
MEVEADSKEDAIEAAYAEWPGMTGYCGNGGNDKLVGVYGENASVEPSDDVEFDSAEEEGN